jgi:hypothetical protein
MFSRRGNKFMSKKKFESRTPSVVLAEEHEVVEHQKDAATRVVLGNERLEHKYGAAPAMVFRYMGRLMPKLAILVYLELWTARDYEKVDFVRISQYKLAQNLQFKQSAISKMIRLLEKAKLIKETFRGGSKRGKRRLTNEYQLWLPLSEWRSIVDDKTIAENKEANEKVLWRAKRVFESHKETRRTVLTDLNNRRSES